MNSTGYRLYAWAIGYLVAVIVALSIIAALGIRRVAGGRWCS